MVAVQVRYEDVVYEREVYVISAQLHLCALAAVNHELLVPIFTICALALCRVVGNAEPQPSMCISNGSIVRQI